MPIAKVLVLYMTPNGYGLYRYDKNGEFAGDTLHETEEDANEQIEYEFSLKDVNWMDIPKDVNEPIKYAIDYMKEKRK